VKSFKDLSEKLKKDKDDPCWKGYVQLGTKKKNGKEVPNCVPKESNEVQEKAVSKAQQRFMGMVRAKQKGEMPDASPEVSKAAASMSKKDVKDFAKTKHKGLPAKKESVEEAKVSVGDRVTLQPNKSVLDRNLIGKAGVVTNMLDGDAMVKFASGRTIAVSPRHLKINESVELEEASGKDIAAKMMKSKSMKAFAAKVARMPNVSAGDLEKMLPDYVSGAEIRGLFKEVYGESVDLGEGKMEDMVAKVEKLGNIKFVDHLTRTRGDTVTYQGSAGKGGQEYWNSIAPKFQAAGFKMSNGPRSKKNRVKVFTAPGVVVTMTKQSTGIGGAEKPFTSVFMDVKTSNAAMKESVELGEANRNHPAAKKLMALAKQRDAGSDAKDYEKAAQMIMKGDAGQLGRYISRMDSYPRDAVISAVKSTDKAMYDKMMGRMESAEPMNFFEFRETLKEAKGSNYQIYHKTYSDAVQHAVNHVFDKMGYEVDSQDFFNKVSSGPRKPSPGKTNSFSIDLFDKRTGKPVRQKLHMQVYGMDSGKYELNMYVA